MEATAAPSSSSSSSSCSLKLLGLPDDATQREVHVLFSGCHGFLRCVLTSTLGAAAAVVHFAAALDAQNAVGARRGTTWGEGTNPVSIVLPDDNGNGSCDRSLEEPHHSDKEKHNTEAPDDAASDALAEGGRGEDQATGKEDCLAVEITEVHQDPRGPGRDSSAEQQSQQEPSYSQADSSESHAAVPVDSKHQIVDDHDKESPFVPDAACLPRRLAPGQDSPALHGERAHHFELVAPDSGSKDNHEKCAGGVAKLDDSSKVNNHSNGSSSSNDNDDNNNRSGSTNANADNSSSSSAFGSKQEHSSRDLAASVEGASCSSRNACSPASQVEARPRIAPTTAVVQHSPLVPAWTIPSDCEEVIIGHEVDRVGFSVSKDLSGRTFVSKVLAGFWAHQVGLEVGDEIVKVNGIVATAASGERLETLLRTSRPLSLLIRQFDEEELGPLVQNQQQQAQRRHQQQRQQQQQHHHQQQQQPQQHQQQQHHQLQQGSSSSSSSPAAAAATFGGSSSSSSTAVVPSAGGYPKPTQPFPHPHPNLPASATAGQARALSNRRKSGEPTLKSIREVGETTPRGRGSSKISNAKATAAFLKLRAAVASRKVPELTRAVEEFVALGLDSEVSGLNFDGEEAAQELEEARRLLSVMDKKATSHRATTSESRARGRLKSAQDLVQQLDLPVDQKVDALDKAEAAALEAIHFCHLAGLLQAEDRLKRMLNAVQESWKVAAAARIRAALKALRESEDKAELVDALEEGECAGLSLEEADEESRLLMDEGHSALQQMQQKRAIRFTLMEAVHSKNAAEIRRALDNAKSLDVEIQTPLLSSAERLVLVADLRAAARWMLFAAYLRGVYGEIEWSDHHSVSGDEDDAMPLHFLVQLWRLRLWALHRCMEMGLTEDELANARRSLESVNSTPQFWQFFQRFQDFRRHSKALADAQGGQDSEGALAATRALEQTRAQQDLDLAMNKKDVQLLRHAIARCRAAAVNDSIIEQAVGMLAEEEMIVAMDEAFGQGDVETLERAIAAWRAQGLPKADLEMAEGMLSELRTNAADVKHQLELILRTPIHFERDSPILASTGRTVLAEVIDLLLQYPTVALDVYGFITAASEAKELPQLRIEAIRTALKTAGCPNTLRLKSYPSSAPRRSAVSIVPRWANAY